MAERITFIVGPVTIGERQPQTRRLPHSPNVVRNMHWAPRSRWTKGWKDASYWAAESALRSHKMYKGMRPVDNITISFEIHAIQSQDPDNMLASMKPIIDGIVQTGIIKDDTKEYISIDGLDIKRVSHREQELLKINLYIP